MAVFLGEEVAAESVAATDVAGGEEGPGIGGEGSTVNSLGAEDVVVPEGVGDSAGDL